MNIKKQLNKLNIFGFTACLRLPDAVWVVLLSVRGFSLWQIGMAEGIFHIVSLLCEIPSGMVADLMGRRRCLAAAGICGILSALFMAFGGGFLGVCLSMVFSALSCNLISGSDEALLYDSLLQVGRAEDYISSSARYTQIQNVSGMLSNFASLLSGIMSYIGFYLLDAAVCLSRVFAALSLTEPTVTQRQALRQANPFQDLRQRFSEHIQEVLRFFRSYPRAAFLMLADGLLSLPSYLTLMFMQQRLSDLGLSTMYLGLPVMCISLSRVLGVSAGKRLKPTHLKALYAACALLTGVGTMLAGAAPILPAIFGAMAAAGSIEAWILHFQNRLNQLVPSDRRATLVSVNMMAYSLLMIAASPLVGWLGDLTSSAGAGLFMLGAAVALAGVTACLPRRKHA